PLSMSRPVTSGPKTSRIRMKAPAAHSEQNCGTAYGAASPHPWISPLRSLTSTVSIAVSTLKAVFHGALSGIETWKTDTSSINISLAFLSCPGIQFAKRVEHRLYVAQAHTPTAPRGVVGVRGKEVQQANDPDVGIEQRGAADLAGENPGSELPRSDGAAVSEIGNRHATVAKELHRTGELGRAATEADRD